MATDPWSEIAPFFWVKVEDADEEDETWESDDEFANYFFFFKKTNMNKITDKKNKIKY